MQTVSAFNGDEVSVNVVLSGNTGFSDLSIELDYDPAVLTLLGVEQAKLTSYRSTSPELTNRPYSMRWVGTSACKSNGILAALTFRVSEDAPSGDYPVSVSFYKGRRGDYEDGVNVNYRRENEQSQTPLGLAYTSGCIRVSPRPVCAAERIDL